MNEDVMGFARGMESLFLGFDIGGTKIAAGVADCEGHFLEVVRVRTPPASSLVELLSSIVAHFERLVTAWGAHLVAVGIGVPGQVRQGVVRHAVNLGIDECPLGDLLETRVGIPVIVENDTSVAALGARHLLRRKAPIENLIYLGIGTGLSAGIILDGRIYRGTDGMAGEIGHLVVDPEGLSCACGARGCLETVISGHGLARQAEAALADGVETILSRVNAPDSRAIYGAVRAGDPLAIRLVERGGRLLAETIAWLLLGFDVEKVVLGGGVVRDGDLLFEIIRTHLFRQYGTSRLFGLLNPDEKIVLVPDGAEVGMLGAWKLASRYLEMQSAGKEV